MKKQLGLQKRMIIIFALFVITVSVLQTVLTGTIVRRAITAKVMELLQNKAVTTAEKIDHEIEDLSFWLEGVADTPVLFDESLSIPQRLREIDFLIKRQPSVKSYGMAGMDGNLIRADGSSFFLRKSVVVQHRYERDSIFVRTFSGGEGRFSHLICNSHVWKRSENCRFLFDRYRRAISFRYL